jgi:hypothetical protein
LVDLSRFSCYNQRDSSRTAEVELVIVIQVVIVAFVFGRMFEAFALDSGKKLHRNLSPRPSVGKV